MYKAPRIPGPKRDERIVVTVTMEEKQRVEAEALATGTNSSWILRQALLAWWLAQ